MESIRKELAALEDENGHIPVQDVIDRARDPNSAMHTHFTWNVEDAAQERWEQQARKLIRSVRFTTEIRDVPMDVVHYVRDNSGYRNIVRVKTEPEKARETIIDEMNRVVRAAEKAKRVAAFLGSQADVEDIKEIARRVISRVHLTPGEA